MRAPVITVVFGLLAGVLLGCEQDSGLLPCPPSRVRSSTTEDGRLPLRWALEPGCVATSYDPIFEPRREAIAAAFLAWSNPACARLCLDPPIARAEPPDSRPARTIHVMPQVTQFPGAMYGLARKTFGTEDGLIRSAIIELSNEVPEPMLERVMLRFVGMSLGFERPGSDVPSVLNDPENDQLTELSADDVGAFCEAYGACF